jgi:hypothetical protein
MSTKNQEVVELLRNKILKLKNLQKNLKPPEVIAPVKPAPIPVKPTPIKPDTGLQSILENSEINLEDKIKLLIAELEKKTVVAEEPTRKKTKIDLNKIKKIQEMEKINIQEEINNRSKKILNKVKTMVETEISKEMIKYNELITSINNSPSEVPNVLMYMILDKLESVI